MNQSDIKENIRGKLQRLSENVGSLTGIVSQYETILESVTSLVNSTKEHVAALDGINNALEKPNNDLSNTIMRMQENMTKIGKILTERK